MLYAAGKKVLAATKMVVGAAPESTPDQKANAALWIKVLQKALDNQTKQLHGIEEGSRIKRQHIEAASIESSTRTNENSPLALHPDLPRTPPKKQCGKAAASLDEILSMARAITRRTPSAPSTSTQITENGTVVAKQRRIEEDEGQALPTPLPKTNLFSASQDARRKQQDYRFPATSGQRSRSMHAGPENTSLYAYGNKVVKICNGHGMGTVDIDNVSLRSKLEEAAAKYIMEVEASLHEISDIHNAENETDDCRCSQRDRADRRCMNAKEHGGKCRFTREGSISFTTALDIVKSLTGPEILKLAGLDDVKTLKGQGNWIQARGIIADVYQGEQATEYLERVDSQETYYNTDFMPHLRAVSQHQCNCLTCGFCDKDNIDDIKCPQKHSHLPSCKRCVHGFAMFQEMKTDIQLKEDSAKAAGTSPMELQKLDQLKCDVETCISSLREYRGHLAHHTSEEEQAMAELENLEDDTAIVTSDYKMKIISCFYRENQRKWKQGTPMLGFMIVTNSEDALLKEKGVKDVSFVMLATNDACQDDWAVACAKSYVYENHLPDHVKKTIFVADGAGCFRLKLHCVIQPFWEHWVNIREIRFWLTPTGNGKTNLDRMFGRTSIVLSTAVDNGGHYYNSDTILDCIEQSRGLLSTVFAGYLPSQENQLSIELAKGERFSSSILTTDPLCQDIPNTGINNVFLMAFKHTGSGSGERLFHSKFVLHMPEGETARLVDIYDTETGLNFDLVELCKPSWTSLWTTTNAKQEKQSHLSRPGEGPNSKVVRSKNQQNRAKTKSKKIQDTVNDRRQQQKDSGLFLCDDKPDIVPSNPKTDGQVGFLLQCFGLEAKLNPSQTMAKMKQEIDPVDNGLKFCSSKAHLQTNGSVLSEEQIGLWQSQEVKKRENAFRLHRGATTNAQRPGLLEKRKKGPEFKNL
ncbi:unnamed protein product [Cylindrotheca closterium]|uniref:Uncharacterized protein n=1 Tax=Cylindrotheca closterium TaxID=2856 RepID=A0AAD2FDH0_9STRA|nr:unnamed protein product [Cylindrotheca closterium]